MARSSSVVWEIRYGGNDTNGGGFKTGASGTDWSQQNAAQYSVTDGVTAGTTTITSATAAFGTDVVGNVMYVAGGTGSVAAEWYEITARVSATEITVDRATGLTTGTGVTLKIGGAFASPAIAALVGESSQYAYLKYNASPYLITSTSSNVSGGRIAIDTNQVHVVGYNTTRTPGNLDANRPTVKINATGVTGISVFTNSFRDNSVWNIIVDGDNKTSIVGFEGFESHYGNGVWRCKVINCTGYSFTGCRTIGCEASAGGSILFNGCASVACWAHDANVTGFDRCSPVGCVASDCSIGFLTSEYGGSVINCVAYSNTSHGFGGAVDYPRYFAMGCLSVSNGGYGFDDTSRNATMLFNCGAYNNTSGAVSGETAATVGFITLTADPFTNAAAGDFSLNSTAGGGAACRGAGFPQTFPVV